MAYAQLNSPLPNLTLSANGRHCCGMRGLGQDDDSDSTDLPLTSPTDSTSAIIDPVNTISPLSPGEISLDDPGTLPLTPSTTDLAALYPASVGTEFISNGDGTYTNIQTGQSVPYATAMAVTGATTGTGTANVTTTGTETGVNLTDPTTGQTYSGTLTATAAALNATGQLVTAAGKLTAAGQALAAQGQLISQPSASSSVSAALTSLSNWFTSQTLMAGVPNWGVMAGLGVTVMIVSSYLSSRPKRRKR